MRFTTLTDVYDALEVWRSLGMAPPKFHFDLDVRGFSKLSIALDSLRSSQGWLPPIEQGKSYKYWLRACPRKRLSGWFDSSYGPVWFLLTSPASTLKNGSSDHKDSIRLMMSFLNRAARDLPLRITLKTRGWVGRKDATLAIADTNVSQSGTVQIERAVELDPGKNGNGATADVYFEIEFPEQSAPAYSSCGNFMSAVTRASLDDAPVFLLTWDGRNILALVDNIVAGGLSAFCTKEIAIPADRTRANS